MNDAVNALLDIGHLLQHLVDFVFVKLQTNKLGVLRKKERKKKEDTETDIQTRWLKAPKKYIYITCY